MGKIKYLLTILFVTFAGLVSVKANTINSIKVNVKLDIEGNAKIEEVWDMSVDRGTEVYKPMSNLGNSTISNFRVSDENGNYSYQESWNVNGTLSSKKDKNGINRTSSGLELCWGMGSYGHHVYTINYDVSNIIYNVTDAQVLYWKFINDSMNPAPKKFEVVVSGPLEYSDTLDVWGYGYKGYAYVSNGKIYMSNEENNVFSRNEYAVLLVKYPLETFRTDNKISTYNEFNDFYTKAKEGSYKHNYTGNYSSYSTNSKFFKYFIFIHFFTVAFIIIAVFFSVISATNNRRNNYKNTTLNKKEINTFRDIPCSKNIFDAFFLSQIFNLNKKKEDLLGAVLLKWIKDKYVTIIKFNKKKLFGITKEVSAIDLTNMANYEFQNEYEKQLYDMMFTASVDGILEENELKKWCSNNYSKFFRWFDKVENGIRNNYVLAGNIIVSKEGKIFKHDVYEVDEKLKDEAKKLYGLKKYLVEFSRIEEKEPIEVSIWEYYLIYAQILGIAKEVSSQFKKLYPELIENSEYSLNYTQIVWINNITRSSINSASSARDRANSYSSGGGGFSSGGGGGGSFGGGSGGGCR